MWWIAKYTFCLLPGSTHALYLPLCCLLYISQIQDKHLSSSQISGCDHGICQDSPALCLTLVMVLPIALHNRLRILLPHTFLVLLWILWIYDNFRFLPQCFSVFSVCLNSGWHLFFVVCNINFVIDL